MLDGYAGIILPEAEITSERLSLHEAIRMVEAEAVRSRLEFLVEKQQEPGRSKHTGAHGGHLDYASVAAEDYSPVSNSFKTALDERGMTVKGRGDTPNQHDMLTGTQHEGTAVPGPDDATCSNWSSSADGQGSAVVGHHDLIGNTQGPNFWNYSHKTPGCAPANLQRVGGAGLFY